MTLQRRLARLEALRARRKSDWPRPKPQPSPEWWEDFYRDFDAYVVQRLAQAPDPADPDAPAPIDPAWFAIPASTRRARARPPRAAR